jgi:hypothetical protein
MAIQDDIMAMLSQFQVVEIGRQTVAVEAKNCIKI